MHFIIFLVFFFLKNYLKNLKKILKNVLKNSNKFQIKLELIKINHKIIQLNYTQNIFFIRFRS